jgi:predicted GIY-YIG superfamily endonuclease
VISRSSAGAQGDIGDAGAQPMWYVYFLELNNKHIYVGSTDDLKRRITSHDNGHVQSTKPFLPAKLKSYVAVETETKARELESYFKSGSGKAVAKKRFL